jgi:hypothetical protein
MQLQNSVYKNIVIIVNPRRRPQCLVTSTWARMRRGFFWSKLEHPCPTFEIHLSETRTWYTFRHWIIQNIPLQWLRLWTPIICNFFRWTKNFYVKETFFTKMSRFSSLNHPECSTTLVATLDTYNFKFKFHSLNKKITTTVLLCVDIVFLSKREHPVAVLCSNIPLHWLRLWTPTIFNFNFILWTNFYIKVPWVSKIAKMCFFSQNVNIPVAVLCLNIPLHQSTALVTTLDTYDF